MHWKYIPKELRHILPLGIKLNKSLYKIGVLYSPVFNNQNTKWCINLVIRSSAETADLVDICIMKSENAQIMKYVLYMYKTQKKKCGVILCTLTNLPED